MTIAFNDSADRDGATAAPPPGADSHPAVFERLEYGKLCLSTEGRIVRGSEAYPLVHSPGFPRELEDLCHPATIGFEDGLPAGCPEGWLVRAAGGPDGVRPLACRLRRRPEDGERGERRSFWLGRFLSAARPLDPWTCFRALRAEPLPALTVEATRVTWPAMSVERRGIPGADPRLRRFLPDAIVHAASAVPIGFVPAISPEQLFHWAAALWALLPAALQAAFAAGWGVAPNHAPALNLSFMRGYPPSVAVFDLLQERWRLPAERENRGGSGQPEPAAAWSDSMLVPGRMYLREAFAWREDGTPDLEEGPRLAYLVDLAPESITQPRDSDATRTAELLDLRSHGMVDRFVRPGIASLDHARLAVLARWLQAPGSPRPEGLCLNVSDYFTAGGKRQVMALGAAAMAAGNVRGEGVVWQSLVADPACFDLLAGTSVPAGEARLHLLHALARHDSGGVLHVLATAPAGALEGPLSAEPARRLEDCLDGDLEKSGRLSSHAAVLRQPAAPAAYRRWAERHAAPLAFALAGLPEAPPSPLRSLARQTGDPCARSIADWREGHRAAGRRSRRDCRTAGGPTLAPGGMLAGGLAGSYGGAGRRAAGVPP